MSTIVNAVGRGFRSLYARIALVYLVSLLLLSLAAAWIAIHQFDQLGREMRQRAQIGLAHNLASVMQAPLRAGVQSPAARQAAHRIMAINPSLLLYVLDSRDRVVAGYGTSQCGVGQPINPAPINRFLSSAPMLPVYLQAPCSGGLRVFSVARLTYGPNQTQGYLLAVLGGHKQLSMLHMLRTSSITRTLVIAGVIALTLSGLLGLILFALLTRRFSRLTEAVGQLTEGHYDQRIEPGPNDEIGRLARAFNEMAATLEAQMNALRENDRQRRELIANLSHDFRTPLTSLRGYAEQLRADRSGSESEREASIEAIIGNTERLTRLARQLSTLARVDAFERPLAHDVFVLAELASDVVGKCRFDAERAGIELSIGANADLLQVRADLALIDRALTNLIENALAATDAGGHVQVDIERRAGRLQVTVVDTGTGIAESDIPLITQRFYRARAEAPDTGSGLGLAIVADICERHGSRLHIESALGVGSRFAFDLPLA